MSNINKLKGKIIIKGQIKLLTGLHIGTGNNFSAIGAVDNVVIRDSITGRPMIPGSSLKGKMRFLLARTSFSDNSLEMAKIEAEDVKIKRLFGSSGGKNEKIMFSRLQFHDSILTDNSAERLSKLDLDLPYTEIKFENTINRATAVANPRQQERVPAGSEFEFKLTYNVEEVSEQEIEEDLSNIAKCMEILQDDYLGGHGSRGYGRILFEKIETETKTYKADDNSIEKLSKILENIK